MTTYTATYSPDDNKIRLYASSRLDKEIYDKVRAAGFRWAPKQELFYATWSPKAEDIAIQLAGEIEDDDKTLTDRAEERAERFEGYQDKRADEAERARDAVSAIADNIPFGQPILVGHHSERRARKDAERIENGMRKAVKLWETSEYWKDRAKGALAHAKYKELPKVRARRIKTIEADMRKEQRTQAEAEKWLNLWTMDGLTPDKARVLAGHCHLGVERNESGHFWTAYDVLRPDEERYKACPAYTLEQVQAKAREAYPRTIAAAQRWIDHYENRLVYEKAMLDEQGASALLDKKPRPAQLPIANYRSENGTVIIENRYHRGQLDTLRQVQMTADEYGKIYTDYKGTNVVENSHRVRIALVKHERVAVFITDSKTHPKPAPITKEIKAPEPRQPAYREPEEIDLRAADFAKLKEAAKNGVEVVSAPELFPTSPELAERVAEEADIQAGHIVLEPSAGTGALIAAAQARGATVTAIELNYKLAGILSQKFGNTTQADFLECREDVGKFDRIVMNPPFANQADIDHVTHAMKFLKDGGRLVAIMSAGVSFRNDRKAIEFRGMVERLGGVIEPLPEGSFKEAGTNVNTVLVTLDAPSKPKVEPTIYREQPSLDLVSG